MCNVVPHPKVLKKKLKTELSDLIVVNFYLKWKIEDSRAMYSGDNKTK